MSDKDYIRYVSKPVAVIYFTLIFVNIAAIIATLVLIPFAMFYWTDAMLTIQLLIGFLFTRSLLKVFFSALEEVGKREYVKATLKESPEEWVDRALRDIQRER